MIPIEAARNQVETHLLYFAETVSSDVRVKKQALTALSCVSAIFALGVASLTFIWTLHPTASFLSIPFLCFSYIVYEIADRLKNYDDPFELQIMKAEALKMSFSELIQEHEGIDPILQYKIASPEMLSSKFVSECEGKALSTIFEKNSFSYVQKYKLMNKEQIRKFFLLELRKENSITNLSDRFGEFGLRELKRAEVISPSEYEALERVHAEEEKIGSLNSSRLLELNTQFFARRENLLSELSRKEKLAAKELDNAHLQDKPVSLMTLYALKKNLKAIQNEKTRVQQEGTLGKSLQVEYEMRKQQLYQETQEKTQKLLKELQEIKDRLA